MLIHSSAIVEDGARIGADTRIWHWVHVMPGAQIGARCSLGQGCFVGAARIGDGCRIQNHVSLFDGVTLEDDVFLGPSCVFTNVRHPRAHIARRDAYAATLVRRGATIGANATIVCGVTIGAYAMVRRRRGRHPRCPRARARRRRARPPHRLGLPLRRDPAGLPRVRAVRRRLHRRRRRARPWGVARGVAVNDDVLRARARPALHRCTVGRPPGRGVPRAGVNRPPRRGRPRG